MWDWITSFIPWPILLILSIAGISAPVAALIFFAPATVPVLLRIWNATPLWLKAVFVGIGGGFIAFAAGKQAMKEKMDEAQRQRDATARTKAQEVTREIENMSADEVDKRLEDTGGFWDDPPAKPTPRKRR